MSKLSEFLIEAPELTLDRVRDVAVLNNDETLIAWINDDKNEVFVTDLNGEFICKFGGRGNGPTEFERISAIGFTKNNDLITYDGHQDLFKIFDIDGTLLNIHEGIMREGLFIRDPRIFSDGEYFYLGIQERSKSGPENHWESHTIAKVSLNEGLVNIFGAYDPVLKGTSRLYKYVNMNYDRKNNRFYTTHRTLPFIQSFTEGGMIERSRFGIIPDNFQVSEEEAKVSDPMHIRRQKNLNQSFVGNSFITDSFLFVHFFNWTEDFYQLEDPNLKPHFLKIYIKNDPFEYWGDIQIKSTPLLTTSDGIIYLMENDDPDNFTVSRNEIKIN